MVDAKDLGHVALTQSFVNYWKLQIEAFLQGFDDIKKLRALAYLAHQLLWKREVGGSDLVVGKF